VDEKTFSPLEISLNEPSKGTFSGPYHVPQVSELSYLQGYPQTHDMHEVFVVVYIEVVTQIL
jgi:hypothetical protein